jgi:hypothetical protein
MTKNTRILWIIAIVAMGLTTAMTLLGGIGTICAAFLTKSFPSLWKDLRYYQWLYQRFVVITIIIGIAGVWVTHALFYSKKYAYPAALALLVAGTLMAELRVTSSLNIRGKMAPAHIKFYLNVFTLIYFLILGLPTFRGRVDFSKAGGKTEITAASGMTALLVGFTMLTIDFWAGASHTVGSTNWIDALQPEIDIGGVLLVLGGLFIFLRAIMALLHQSQTQERPLLSEAPANL